MSSTTFSYAQAAKGHSASQPSPQLAASPSPAPESTHIKDEALTAPLSSAAPSQTPSHSETREPTPAVNGQGESTVEKSLPEDVGDGEAGQSTTSTADSTTLVAHDGDSVNTDLNTEPDDKTGRSSSRASRSVDSADARKGRKGKKGKAGDKDIVELASSLEKDPELQKPVFTEAPLPTVNPWTKRQETQTVVKVKAAPAAPSPVSGSNVETTTSTSKDRLPAEVTGSAGGGPNGIAEDKPQRKSVDLSRAAEQGTRRPRGARAAEKDEKAAAETVPSVDDTSLWPTPELSAVAEDSKRKPQEKEERTEKEAQEDAAPVKRTKEKWSKIDFTPTAVFQTPLPQRSGNKTRTGGRGGREGGARGGHSAAASSSAAASASEAGESVPTTNGTGPNKTDRRHNDGGVPSRSASLPNNAAKRASVDVTYSQNQRKPSAPIGNDRAAEFNSDASASISRDSSRANHGGYVNGDQPSYARPGQSDRLVGGKTAGGLKEYGLPSPRDAGRPEGRGRGGRGRGGYNGAVGAHAQQPSFQNGGQYAVHTPISNRSNGPYSPPPNQGSFGNPFSAMPRNGHSGRGNRGHAGNNGYGRGQANGASSAGPRLPQLNTANGFYEYQGQNMSGYPVSYTPVDPTFFQVLQKQVEYYLSVDNLCKDMYIRRNMDSQGFVPLSLIAGFKRMKDLAPNLDVIRSACATSELLDFVIGDDQQERLRLRSGWESFVLKDMSERDEPARNDGPQHVYKAQAPGLFNQYPDQRMFPPPFHMTSPTSMNGAFTPEDQFYQPQQAPYYNGGHFEPTMNGGGGDFGVNGMSYGPDTQLSAAVPEFSPGGQTGLGLDRLNTMSDQATDHLTMVLENSASVPGSSAAPPPAGPNGVTGFNHPIVNGSLNGAVDVADSGEVLTSFVAPSSGSEAPAQPPVPTTEGDEQKQQPASQNYHQENYPAYRAQALGKRSSAKPGETPMEMKNLYGFWREFFTDNFNARMYDDFVALAMEDAAGSPPALFGLKYLLKTYDHLLDSTARKPWGDAPVPQLFKLHRDDAILRMQQRKSE